MKWTVTGRQDSDLAAAIVSKVAILERRYARKRVEVERFAVKDSTTTANAWSISIDDSAKTKRVRRRGSDPDHFVVVQFLDANDDVLFQMEAKLQDYLK